MCDFISWIELDGRNYFLTKKELRTKRGKELMDYLGDHFYDDVKGHGAIDFYYELQGQGKHHECEDFSDPNNFPPEIVSALKNGAFDEIGLNSGLLNSTALAECEKARDAARVEYGKARDAARVEYEKARATARVECEKACDAARVECEKARATALAEYEKTIMSALWDLFRDPENRASAWR